jgi:hypothetical protein
MSQPITITLDPGEPIAARVAEFVAAHREAIAAAPPIGVGPEQSPGYVMAANRRYIAAQALIDGLNWFVPVEAAR